MISPGVSGLQRGKCGGKRREINLSVRERIRKGKGSGKETSNFQLMMSGGKR